MRIVVNPDSLASTSLEFSGASDELIAISTVVGGASLPAMPPSIATVTAAALGDVAASWRASAQEYADMAFELRLRAGAAVLGGPFEALLRWYMAANHHYEGALDKLGPFAALLEMNEGVKDIVVARIGSQILRDVDAVGAARFAFGDGALETTNAWLRLEQRVSAFTSLTENPGVLDELFAGGPRTTAALSKVTESIESAFKLGPLSTVMEAADKVVTPLAIVGNISTIVGPGRYSQGWRNDIDKGFAAAAIVGLVAAPEIAGPILLAQGGWQLGNWAYDNRHELSHDAVAVGHAAWSGVQAGYHDTGHVVSGAEHAASSLEHKAGHFIQSLNPF